MQCEMCGATGNLFIAIIEGTRLRTCENCGKMGEIKGKVAPEVKKKEKIEYQAPSYVAEEETEIIEYITENYANLVRNARNKTGMNQEQFAQKLGEKVSVIHKLETGHHEPSIKLAGKLERTLGIKLIQVMKQGKIQQNKTENFGPRTIGDLLKKK